MSFACASDRALRSELAEVRRELTAIRQGQAAMERRLERVEMIAAVNKARQGANTPAARPGGAEGELPALTVVKLKPAAGAAPRLDTSTPVVEPPPELVEELATRAPSRAAETEEDDDPVPEVDPAQADREWDQAMSALRTGNLRGASEALDKFAAERAVHPRADNALYFSAMGLMGLEEYSDAAERLEKLVREYPAGDAVLDGMLKLAECRVKLNQGAAARQLYHQVISNHPGTAAATTAQARLAALGP